MSLNELKARWLADAATSSAYNVVAPIVRIGAQACLRRHELKLSQVELARKARVTQRQVSNLENGKANVTMETLSRVAAALALDISLVAVGPSAEQGFVLLGVLRGGASTAQPILPQNRAKFSSTATVRRIRSGKVASYG